MDAGGQLALGRSLAAARRAAGFTQDGLSVHVSYSRSTVGNVEKGRQSAARDFWERCDTVLGQDGALLAVRDRLVGDSGPDDGGYVRDLGAHVVAAVSLWQQDRRRPSTGTQASLVGDADSVLPVWEWEHPPEDIDVSRRASTRLGTAELGMLVRARSRYEEMYRRVGGLPTHTRLVVLLTEQVAPMLRAGYNEVVGRTLFRHVGSLAALAGICCYDMDDQALAQRYFFQALRLAKASGDRAFGGYIVALLANQAMYLGDHRRVVQYAEAARRGAGPALSPALVADLHALVAKAYARMHDARSCHEHMTLSERAATRIDLMAEPRECGYVSVGMIACQHGEALRQLGDFKAARSYAEQAAGSVAVSHHRGRVHRYAGLALLLAEDGHVDEALEPARRMLDEARGMESARIADRVRRVCRVMAHHSDSRIVGEIVQHAREELGISI